MAATSVELAHSVARALGLGPETVRHHVRNIGRAGFISYSGRGRHAARMTELDAARLTIAAAGSLQVKDSLETLERFRVLTDTRRRPDAEGFMPGGAAVSLETFLALRIARLREGPPESSSRKVGAWPRYNLSAHVALELTAPLGAGQETVPAFATVRWFTAAGGAEKADFAPADAQRFPLDAAQFAKQYGGVGLFDTRYVSARALEAIAFSL
jgi:hypothetical protein